MKTGIRRYTLVWWIVVLGLSVISLIFLFPFLWMFLTTVKPEGDLFSYPPKWLPSEWRWGNYLKTLRAMPFLRYTANSLIIAVGNVVAMILSSSLAAFGLVRYRFKGREFVFTLLIAAMIIPINVLIVPQYMLFSRLKWIDTFYPLIVPSLLGYSLGTFLLRQFFATIPVELDDAAMMDGANALRILYSIYMPLSVPAVITVSIFMFIYQWNDLLRPIIFLSNKNLMTLPVGLVMMMGQYTVQWNLLMCAALLSMLPIMILFLFLQKYYIEGITMTSIKG
jgi:multiple sugar transport system permease protein